MKSALNLTCSTKAISLNTTDQSKEILKTRLLKSDDMRVYNFEEHMFNPIFKFDFYSPSLQIAIQLVDSLDYYDEFDNPLSIKGFYYENINLKVIKVTDYQVMIDLEQVIRFIKKNYIFKVL